MVAIAWMANTYLMWTIKYENAGNQLDIQFIQFCELCSFFSWKNPIWIKWFFLSSDQFFRIVSPIFFCSSLARSQTISICVIIFGRQLCVFFIPIRCTKCQMCAISGAANCVRAWVLMWSIRMYSAILRNSIKIWMMYLAALHRDDSRCLKWEFRIISHSSRPSHFPWFIPNYSIYFCHPCNSPENNTIQSRPSDYESILNCEVSRAAQSG